MPPRIPGLVRAAAVAALAAAALLAWSLWQALVLEPLPIPSPVAEAPSIAAPERETFTLQAVLTAVDRDPFRPDRRRAPERFRLPHERMPDLLVSDQAFSVPVPVETVQLIGTVVLPEGGGVAMCQLGMEPPRLVRVGERIGEYTLRSVARGRATFVSDRGDRLEVHVPKAGI